MCLAIPALVTERLDESRANVRLGGAVQEISTVLVDDVRTGDYVIVHVGFALCKVNEEEARKTLDLMNGIGDRSFGVEES
jgi:hydrogenase expression/formation protein HypC